jgi:glycosyltransferase involved in cell wall biosynthesis
MMKPIILIPALNEVDTIGPCITELRKAFGQDCLLVVLDNGSTDGTGAAALDLGARVVAVPEKGKGNALLTGMRLAVSEGHPWIVLHDADMEYDALDLAHGFELILSSQGNNACVMGVGARQVSLSRVLWRSLAANAATRAALRLRCGEAPLDILTGSRVFNLNAACALLAGCSLAGGFEVEAKLTGYALLTGMHIIEYPVRYQPRAVELKKIKPLDMVPILRAAWSPRV